MTKDALTELLAFELADCRNELCLRCGRYRESYLGACDSCRYREGGHWQELVGEALNV